VNRASAVDPDSTLIDSVQVHPTRYIQAIGVQPQDSYGFVPAAQEEGPVPWVMAYRDGPVTAAARRAPGTAPPSATMAIDRLYPKLRPHGWSPPVDHFLGLYREVVGLRAADTWGLLPLGVIRSMEHHELWQAWYLVYRERPEYAQRRRAYAEEMGEPDEWPDAQVIPGAGDAGPLPPAEGGKIKVEEIGLQGISPTADPEHGLPGRVMEALVRAGSPPERCFAVRPDYRQRSVQVLYVA
jgi:hypothetical protein